MQFFRKSAKKHKMVENLGKKVQNLKIFWKREGDCMRVAPVYTLKVKLLKKTSIFLSEVTKMLSGWNNVWRGYGT